MLLSAISIRETSVLSPSMSKRISSCDISVRDEELSCSSGGETQQKKVADLSDCVRATYEYYSGKDKDLKQYRDGPETLRKYFIGTTIDKIKSHPWTEEGTQLIDAVHWSEKIQFEELKKKGPVSLSYSLLNSPSAETANRCYAVSVTRNSVYEWWNEYRIWKKFGEDADREVEIENPGSHEEFRERFIASSVDEDGHSQLTKVLREQNGKLIEKYIYVEEKFIVQKFLQAPLIVALYELCNFVPKIVSNSKHWVNSSAEERQNIVRQEVEYFEDIQEMAEMMHVAHKGNRGNEETDGGGEKKPKTKDLKKSNRVSPFAAFCKDKKGEDYVTPEEKKTYGALWRKMSDDQKAQYGDQRVKAEKNKREEEPPEEKSKKGESPKRAKSRDENYSPPPSSGDEGVLVGRSIENVAEELDRYFNSNLFEDEQKKFTWNLFYKNMKAAAKKKKTTSFDRTCLKPAYDAYVEDPDTNHVRFLKMIVSDSDSAAKNVVQAFNVLFSRPEAPKEEKDDFIF